MILCITGFESDYNLFCCEAGTPMFNYLGAAKTFIQWQALGYDIHSKVINPNFINFTDFVPDARLDYGTNLGTTWQTGLSTTAVWNAGSSLQQQTKMATGRLVPEFMRRILELFLILVLLWKMLLLP